jgi:hypothetical protein
MQVSTMKNVSDPAAANPALQQRIKRVNLRLMKVQDPDWRNKLEQRLAHVKSRQHANKGDAAAPGTQPGLARRLQRINRLLSQTEEKRQNLEKRKVHLESQMSAQNDDKKAGTFPQKPDQRLTLEQRVKRIEHRLSNPKIPDKQRQKLTQRLSILKDKQQEKLATTEANPFLGNIFQKRVNRIQARLAKQGLGLEQREKLQERLTILENKLDNNHQAGTNCSNLEQRLKRQEQLLEKENLSGGRRHEVERRIARIRAKLQNQGRRSQDCGAQNVRERNQKCLMSLEQRAREAGNETALARIALQQVYVAHYPTEDHEQGSQRKYTPVFSKQVKEKAVIRQRALELARSEPGADWIAADQYERLPDNWTLDDEIATFGKGKKGAPFKHGVLKGDEEEDAGGDSNVEIDGFEWVGGDLPPGKATELVDEGMKADG